MSLKWKTCPWVEHFDDDDDDDDEEEEDHLWILKCEFYLLYNL